MMLRTVTHMNRARLLTIGAIVASTFIALAACGSSAPAATSPSTSAHASSEPSAAPLAPSAESPAQSSGAAPSSASSVSAAASGVTTAAADPSIAAQVPEAIAKKGTLLVAVDAEYAPDEFVAEDGKTIVGMDPDLAYALGGVLGLKVTLQNVAADAIIPGIRSGKYDLSLSSWNDTAERQAQVDFVTYYQAGTSFMIKAGSSYADVDSLDALCGHIVGVETAASQVADVTDQSKKCTDAGKAAVTISQFPNQNDVNLALSSGRVQVVLADSPVAAYQVKQSGGKFQVVGEPYGVARYGIISQKNSGMTAPLLAAVQKLMANGVYESILEKWGLQAGAISDPAINIAN